MNAVVCMSSLCQSKSLSPRLFSPSASVSDKKDLLVLDNTPPPRPQTSTKPQCTLNDKDKDRPSPVENHDSLASDLADILSGELEVDSDAETCLDDVAEEKMAYKHAVKEAQRAFEDDPHFDRRLEQHLKELYPEYNDLALDGDDILDARIARNIADAMEGAGMAREIDLCEHSTREEEKLTAIHEAWSREAVCGMEALMQRELALASTPLDSIEHLGNMSMMVVRDSDGARFVSLVNWGESKARFGQLVSLDAHNRAIFAIAHLSPFKDLADATVVTTDVGIRMLKVKAPERPQLPSKMVRLKATFEQALHNHDQSSSCIASCVVCCSYTNAEGLEPTTCPACLMAWHGDCSRELRQAAGKMPTTDEGGSLRKRAPIPEMFEDGLCSLCSYFSEWETEQAGSSSSSRSRIIVVFVVVIVVVVVVVVGEG